MKNGKGKFKIGQLVRVAVRNSDDSTTRFKATVVRGVPRGAQRGAARLTVCLLSGEKRRPFPSQCRPVV